jgi:sugar fermentation stimulation protein A
MRKSAMRFHPPLFAATLLRRRKRFLADVRFADGSEVTVFCPNTGRMLGCTEAGSEVWLSSHDSATRKYRHCWEISTAKQVLVGVNPSLANGFVRTAIDAGVILPLQGYSSCRGEVRYGENSRIDWLLEDPERPPCYVEVKSVTAADEYGIGFFPDAVSERGAKHMRELAGAVAGGARAVVIFCVQRGDALAVRAADEIDPAYGRAMRAALQAGVEVYAYRADVSPQGIVLSRRIPVLP